MRPLPAQTAAAATPPHAAALRAAVLDWTGGVVPRPGRVEVEIAPLVENGNSVPITVGAASPMTAADHVRAIAIFNERNPQRDVAVFHFTPASGRAQAATRIRLATSQTLAVVARMSDGSVWSREVEVLVTLAACIES
jgi:sulfur-oxidizing protein SoxY